LIVPQLRFATERLQTGLLMHYAEQGDPKGAPIVFFHGWPDSWFSFSGVLQLLTPAYHAYAIDQRGFGDSEHPATGYSIDRFAADGVAFLDAVGVGRATLVGHSMGSLIARRMAETHPERVAGLVLISSAATTVNEVTREVQAAVRDLEGPIPPEFVREFQASTLHVPVPELFFEGLVAESLKAPARVWRSAFDGLLAFDDAAELGRIAAPTLIIWGEHDALFSRTEQERLAAAIPAARLAVYSEAGHSPNWEYPERLAADLEAFIGRAQSTPAGRPL
jgi:pimeloyl-ACP methyl ester carboxylesterase